MELTKHLREHYNLISLIHKSKSNEIWLAEDALKQKYALKIIRRTGSLYSEIAAINHPNLPKIFYVEETDSATYVVEEYLRGQNLQEYLDAHGAFAENVVARFGIELCDCLEEFHKRHIIHRDIKPANLFLTDTGELKLIDFDAARLEKPDSVADTYLIGTPGFAAPEQYGFHQTDERTDIYALGLTLKMLAGYKNYRGFLSAVFDKCTEFDPDKRYDSAKNLRRAIIFRNRIHDGRKFFVTTCAGVLSLGIYFLPASTPQSVTPEEKISVEEIQPVKETPPVEENISPVQYAEEEIAPVIEQENPPLPTYVEPNAEENYYQVEPSALVEPENFHQPEPPVDRVADIVAETAQIVEEKDFEPPPQMSRSDFANRMRNLNLSDEELDAKQEEYQRRLEMNQRIREFKAELPDDMDADERREAIRIYTLQERDNLQTK